MDMQRFTVLGRASTEPEIKTSKNGEVSWAQFNLACNYRAGDTDRVNFYRVKVFSKVTQDNVVEYIKKGSRVLVEGIPQANAYNDKEGNLQKSIDISATMWNCLDSKPQEKTKSKKSEL
jgi:single stranded DNA-binding protein